MTSGLPLPTLLSQVLVALTIEFDNESEHLISHRTTRSGRAAPREAPWLVSQVMWSNVMQFVGEEGITVHDLHVRACTTRDLLNGLQRWGYVTLRPDPAGTRAVPGTPTPARARTKPSTAEFVVYPTPAGRRAQEVWRNLASEIEQRWRTRFGCNDVDALRELLGAVVAQLDVELPEYLPIVYPTNNGKAEIPRPASRAPDAAAEADVVSRLDLSALV